MHIGLEQFPISDSSPRAATRAEGGLFSETVRVSIRDLTWKSNETLAHFPLTLIFYEFSSAAIVTPLYAPIGQALRGRPRIVSIVFQKYMIDYLGFR